MRLAAAPSAPPLVRGGQGDFFEVALNSRRLRWFPAPLLAGQLTFPSEAADRKIDYIFTSQTVRVTSAHVITKMASDHFPVTAEIAY